MNITGWLQIQCPDPARIWKLALKARSVSGRNITSWSISASNDGLTLGTLLTSTISILLGAATIDVLAAYQYYKFNLLTCRDTPDTGVHYMILYTVDNLTS